MLKVEKNMSQNCGLGWIRAETTKFLETILRTYRKSIRKIYQKIETLVKNRNLGQESKF